MTIQQAEAIAKLLHPYMAYYHINRDTGEVCEVQYSIPDRLIDISGSIRDVCEIVGASQDVCDPGWVDLSITPKGEYQYIFLNLIDNV